LNPLHLSGWGVKVAVEDMKSRSHLKITNGRLDDKQSTVARYPPRRFPYSSIIVDGYSGYFSLRAIHWLSRNGTSVYVLDVDGSLLSSILPATPLKADLRVSQMDASRDLKKKFTIAHAIVKAKVARSFQVLEWLEERYDLQRQIRLAKSEAVNLRRVSTVGQLRTAEGRVALRYWDAIRKILPEHLEFRGRMTSSHNNNASDPVNSALNYGYALLEGECRRAINVVGLESSIGFLHDFSDYQTKQSLVYDVMEPYRWLVDITVLQAFESRMLDLDTFHFKFDDYRFRFNPEAKERFIELLKERFNSGVRYRGQQMKWDTVIEQKTNELGRFLAGKRFALDFMEPSPTLMRFDSRVLRSRILSLNASEAKRVGIPKQSLHDLRLKARRPQPFKLHTETMRKLRTVQ